MKLDRKESTNFTLRMSVDQRLALEKIAAKEDRTITNLINVAIKTIGSKRVYREMDFFTNQAIPPFFLVNVLMPTRNPVNAIKYMTAIFPFTVADNGVVAKRLKKSEDS